MSHGTRALVISLAAVLGFLVPLLVLYVTGGGSFFKDLFGGGALCIATCLAATVFGWIAVTESGSRRRNAGLIGVLLGLGAGFGAITVLTYTPWSLDGAGLKIAAMFAAPLVTTLVGALVGFAIAKGAPSRVRGYYPTAGSRYQP